MLTDYKYFLTLRKFTGISLRGKISVVTFQWFRFTAFRLYLQPQRSWVCKEIVKDAFSGMFTKELRKATGSLVVYVCLSIWNTTALTGGIFVKFRTGDFYWTLSRKFKKAMLKWDENKRRFTWIFTYVCVIGLFKESLCETRAEAVETFDNLNMTIERDWLGICRASRADLCWSKKKASRYKNRAISP